ncbi:MAG: phosphocholine cytidylyltransferase family protein [bacterium]
MKAIIIAGGLGSRLRLITDNKPKCMLKIAGKTILQRQIEVFRKYGVNDIVIVTGYKKEKINYSGIKYYDDSSYQIPSILRGLFCAEKEMKDGFISSYSDIIYTEDVVKKLLDNQNDISLVIDTDWQDYYRRRTKHPIEEAENVIIQNGKIVKIGKHLKAEESHGEFIGLAKFSKKGAEIFKKKYQKVKKKYLGKPFHEAKIFERAYLTDMFQELIGSGIDIYPAKIKKNWWEIDTDQDLRKVKKILGSKS